MRESAHRTVTAVQEAAARYLPLLSYDAAVVFLSYGLALLLRFDWRVPPHYVDRFLDTVWALAVAHCLANGICGLYGRLWRYAGAPEAVIIGAAGGLTSITVFAIELLMRTERHLPLSVIVAGGLFTTGGFVVVRYGWQLVMTVLSQSQRSAGTMARRRVLVVGAGGAGQLLAWQVQHHDRQHEYELVGFVDDDARKQGLRLHGLPVLGSREDIPHLARQRRVDLIIIAIHRISGPEFREILSLCQQTEAQVKVLPDVLSLLKQPATFPPARDVEPRDLLGRREVPVDEDACRSLLKGKAVLVTGACGSIGSELCRQIMRFEPRKLLMVDHNETGLYDMRLGMEASATRLGLDGRELAYVIADVTDENKMAALMAEESPQIVFHAAAYKHVPLLEAYPEEAVRVNVRGTRVLCQLAQQSGVERFVLISTDKAVHPCSSMGLSKRIGELLILALDSSYDSRFTAVRFGNVLGSQGSVVPTFIHQIARGGPVTLTNEHMSRYFMTPTEAVSLIIQAATLTQGGDIFLLDMGQEIKIVDLAQKMIRLQGLRVQKDIDIVYTGIRPGEKLHEELTYEGLEEREPTVYSGISRLNSRVRPSLNTLLARIDELELLARNGSTAEIAAHMHQTIAEETIACGRPDG